MVSCEKDIPLGNEVFKKKLVINSFNRADSFLSVNISESVNILGIPSSSKLSGDAKVLVLKDGLILFNDFIKVDKGNFTIPFKCLRQSVYELQVAFEGYPSIRAKDSVPLLDPVFEIDTLISQLNGHKLIFELNDPVQRNNYYLQLFAKGKQWNGTDSLEVTKALNYIADDKIFISNLLTISRDNSFSLFDDELINGNTRKMSLKIDNSDLYRKGFVASEIILKLSNVSETMYVYYLNLLENTHVYGGPLASTSRENGNIDQGLGVFCFYSNTTRKVKIP